MGPGTRHRHRTFSSHSLHCTSHGIITCRISYLCQPHPAERSSRQRRSRSRFIALIQVIQTEQNVFLISELPKIVLLSVARDNECPDHSKRDQHQADLCGYAGRQVREVDLGMNNIVDLVARLGLLVLIHRFFLLASEGRMHIAPDLEEVVVLFCMWSGVVHAFPSSLSRKRRERESERERDSDSPLPDG